MAANVVASGADEPGEEKPSRPMPPSPRPSASRGGQGFFTIYKKGQGTWTRLGTVGGVVLIGGLTIEFLWSERGAFSAVPDRADRIAYIVIAAFIALYGGLAFYLLNRPTNVDFLIATDSEMKKVNWTSRKELIGSTKVVIGFMFFIAIFLFGVDLMFNYFFYLIGVLKVNPFH